MSHRSFVVAIFIFISIWILCIASGNKCPPPEVLYPCHCESPDDPVVRCINLTRMETINEIFKESADLRFKYFVLEDSTLMFLPASSLVSKRFYGLMILRTKLIGLFDAVPSSSNTIAAFSLQEVVIQRGIKWEYFQKFSKLVNLQLIKINIKTLGKEFATNVPSGLRHFSMMHTNTTKLADGVFARLDSIYAIVVSNNRIKELKRNMFARPCSIRSFDFPWRFNSSKDSDRGLKIKWRFNSSKESDRDLKIKWKFNSSKGSDGGLKIKWRFNSSKDSDRGLKIKWRFNSSKESDRDLKIKWKFNSSKGLDGGLKIKWRFNSSKDSDRGSDGGLKIKWRFNSSKDSDGDLKIKWKFNSSKGSDGGLKIKWRFNSSKDSDGDLKIKWKFNSSKGSDGVLKIKWRFNSSKDSDGDLKIKWKFNSSKGSDGGLNIK
ncbi:hypothetical protein HNY73_003748 [Argiope bruennichi]|uniref:Uncharacterized protein n=1 Tax=Argiope bruennichi TaxID=94029 RepID=A0A8T0FNH2_ARGBR|nr:hypothetical protein HNY73_003748 [Argiope bruennichi]